MNGSPGWIEQYPDPLSPAQIYTDPIRNYYVLQHNVRAESSVPSTIGTIKFYDFRGFCPTCPLPNLYTADVTKFELKIAPMFCPGSYASSSGAATNCVVDMTSHPTGNACSMHWEMVKEGQIVSGNNASTGPIAITQYATVKLWTQGWGDIPNLVPGAYGFKVNGFMQQMRIEVDKPLRSDLDGDGTVTLADFNIMKSEFFGTDQCGCANYWPGISMP
jgi:hypothetical protein